MITLQPHESCSAEMLDDVAADRLPVTIHRVFALEEIAEVHAIMEANGAAGKLVVRVS